MRAILFFLLSELTLAKIDLVMRHQILSGVVQGIGHFIGIFKGRPYITDLLAVGSELESQ